MERVHYSTIKNKIMVDLDLQDEDWIESGTELLGYVNEAIEDAEGEIHELGIEERYFKTRQLLTLNIGDPIVELPIDIYGWKILGIWYNDGDRDVYEVKRFKDEASYQLAQVGDRHRYMVDNDSDDGPRLLFGPVPAANDTTHFTIVYIRHARPLIADTTDPTNLCDIPESINYIYALAKLYVKEKAGVASEVARAETKAQQQRELMLQKLANQIQDGATLIPMDLSSYYEQGGL